MAFYGDEKHNENMEYQSTEIKISKYPKFIHKYYEGSYNGVCFEIKEETGSYREVNWIDDNKELFYEKGGIDNIEQKIIDYFNENKNLQ